MKKKGTKVLVDVLKNWQIDHVYGIPGDSIDTVVEALREEQEAIKFIHVRHEEVAALSAAAYAKLTGKIAVALSIAGPGAIHLLNGMYDAKMDSVPMLVLAGQVVTDKANTKFFQEVDLPTVFEDVAVYNKLIESADNIAEIVDQAIETAYQKKGVAVLTIPNDILLKKIDAPALQERSFNPVYPQLDEAKISESLQLLKDAKKPVILAGIGTKQAKGALKDFIEQFKVPVITTLPAKGILHDSHPNLLGNIGKIGTKPAYEAMQEADLLIMLGNDYPYIDYFPKKQITCIQVDIDPRKMSRRYPADIEIVGDVKEVLQEWNHAGIEIKERGFLKACQDNMKNWRTWLEEDEAKDGTPIAPEAVMADIRTIAEENAIYSIDVGTSTVWSTRYLQLGPQNDFLISSWLATMGCALPGAIAAKIAQPERQVLAITGDGGFSMVMQDFVTAVHYQLPMIVIILNNQELSFIKYEQQSAGELNYGIDLPDINYALFAEACGGKGYQATTRAELQHALRQAKDEKVPVIIDVHVDADAAPLPGKIIWEEAKGYLTFEGKTLRKEHKLAKMPPFKTILRRFL
ncbi:pyruvate oxidase [Listeria sp. PSOL-1]|uniref:pyruvate oxidase n=1 Tax=Listeria sp. PSOL-1 TaxID=1844999 RepID=UPI0013D8B2CB|nr:pyruvate oxidase [Listeria sp. PSOL-1]